MGVCRAVSARRQVRPHPNGRREQFEGVVWRFRTGSQWRVVPELFGVWQRVHQRFVKWRDAGVFEALLEGAIAGAAKGVGPGLSLGSVDFTTVRAHHDAAGVRLDYEVVAALEEAALEREEAARK
nr:transposase [Streptomyces sp. 3211]